MIKETEASKGIRELILLCLQWEAAKRPTAGQITMKLENVKFEYPYGMSFSSNTLKLNYNTHLTVNALDRSMRLRNYPKMALRTLGYKSPRYPETVPRVYDLVEYGYDLEFMIPGTYSELQNLTDIVTVVQRDINVRGPESTVHKGFNNNGGFVAIKLASSHVSPIRHLNS